MRAVLVIVCLTLSGCSGGDAQDPTDEALDQPGSLHLTVLTENELPVKGARISISGTDVFGDTGQGGTFHAARLAPATYEVHVQASTFLPASREVEVLPATQTNLTIELQLDPSVPSNPHVHNLWGGSTTYTMMDATVDISKYPPHERPFTPVEEPLGGMVTRPNGVATDDTFFIPVVERDRDPAIVLPGTKTMTITVDWDPAQVGFRNMGVAYDPPNGDAKETEMFGPGESVTIDVDPDWWDDGHRSFTRWMLRGFHDNQADQPTSWNPVVVTDGNVDVKIVLEKGDLDLDAAHPDHWDGKEELVLRKSSGTNGGAPLGVGQRRPESGLRLDDGMIVPPDAKIMRIEFTWVHNQGDDLDREDYELTWRTAAQNPQTTHISDFQHEPAVEGSAADQYKLYEIPLQPGDGDGVYDTSTGWRFVPWMSATPEDGYRIGGITNFDMVVTVYK